MLEPEDTQQEPWPEAFEQCEVCDDIVAECTCGENPLNGN